MSGNISGNSSDDQVSAASSSVWKWPENRQIVRIYQIKLNINLITWTMSRDSSSDYIQVFLRLLNKLGSQIPINFTSDILR